MNTAPSETQPAEGDVPPEAQHLRRWGLLAAIAGGAVLLALLGLLAARLVLTNARPPLGLTAVADLQPGSCLAEAGADLAEYTVVDCSSPHPQQVVALVDLSLGRSAFIYHESLAALAQETCERYLEYDLYVEQETGVERLSMLAIGLPTEAAYTSGRTNALCAVVATDGSDLMTDEYRPIR